MSGSTSKGRKKMSRNGSKKNPGLNQNSVPSFDGAYGNQNLVHVLLSLMGKKCRAKVRNGSVYEGIFHTFNQKMDVSMNVVHKCDTESDHSTSTNGVDSKLTNGCPKEEELIEQMMFLSENFVSACFEDVDLSFAALDANEANGEAVNQSHTAKTGEKKLELWNGGGDALGGNFGGLEDQSANGWDAGEMFSCNEEKFGVKSDYDSSLSNYTMQLDMKETEKDLERIANATRIAQEIESGVDYKQRADLENDEKISEEDKYSGVVRERDARRGPRERDFDHGGYHERERGDRDIANQTSPHNYRSKHEYDRVSVNSRARGRGRDSRDWEKRNQQGYNSCSTMGPSRSAGPGGPSSNRNNQYPMQSHIDGPGGQIKSYRNNTTQSHLPPRMRQNENMMHNSYSQAKNQRQARMQRSSNGRGPWSPDFPHSPLQTHQESTGQQGGVPLSRTSSSSSNTSVHTPNHRKHPSTSSQEEQHSHQHINQIPSSPTDGINNGNGNPQQSMTRMQIIPSVPQSETSLESNIQKLKIITCPKILKRQVETKNGEEIVIKAQGSAKKKSPQGVKTDAAVNESSFVKLHRPQGPDSPIQVMHTVLLDQFLRDDDMQEQNDFTDTTSKCNLNMPKHRCAAQSQTHFNQTLPTVQTVFPMISQKHLQPVSLTIGASCLAQPCRHVYHQHPGVGLQYFILHGPTHAGMAQNGSTFVPVPNTQTHELNTSYASIASRNSGGGKSQLGPGITDLTSVRVAQGSPTSLPNQPPHSTKHGIVEGVVTVHTNATYTYTPKGSTPPINHHSTAAISSQIPGNMTSPRMQHGSQPVHLIGDHMRGGQMMGRVPQQNMMTMSPMQHGMQQQHLTNNPAQLRQQPSQANKKIQPSTSEQQKQQMEKTQDETKPNLKIADVSLRSNSSSGKGRTASSAESSLDDLKKFGENFKLRDNVGNKESTGASTQSPQNRVQQRQPSNMPQPPVVTTRSQPLHPKAPIPQPGYQSSPQQQQQPPYPITMSHPENINAMQHSSGQVTANMMMPPAKMVQHTGQFPHMQHPQQLNSSKMTQQIPMAPPNIQQFSVPSHQHLAQAPPQTVDGTKIINGVVVQQTSNQKIMTPLKAEAAVYQSIGANVHVPTGPPLSQANPPAVITVSAAASSPIVSNYPTMTTQAIQSVQNQHDQTPTVSTPVNESSVSSPTPSITSPTSVNIKALNPEAQEFKPRTPAKGTQAPTPQTQPVITYVSAYPPNMTPGVSAMGPQPATQLTPVYNTGPIDHMQAPMQQMYPQFHQQQFLLQPQQVVQQIHGPQQFATFENPGQVYPATAPQGMMSQSTRMAAMPATPQYQPDQSANVYVPVQTQGSNYLQQRPQSANTPTATHVTATSPANPSSHQVQQPTGHPSTMVPAHGIQGGSVPGQVWMVPNTSNFMMVQGSQPPQHLQHPSGMHINQPPPQPPSQYMPAAMPQSGMPNIPAQQKSQPQAMPTAHYITQSAQRSYNQYQSPSTNN